jgi:hypothetical protein
MTNNGKLVLVEPPKALDVAKDQCSNCDAWVRTNGADGECRAVPPTPIMLRMQQMPRLHGLPGGGPQPVIHSFFPAIKEFGWCRHHKRKVEGTA